MMSGTTNIESVKIAPETAISIMESPIPIRLPDGRSIVWKEQLEIGEQGDRTAASWLGTTLKHTYGRHQLSSSEDQIFEQVRSGEIEPIFIEKNGEPDACAALIHGLRTVELGRAANALGGRGAATLMWKLSREWESREDDPRPLVAEIRMAAPFEGIDGGQGSQATLLNPKKVGMIPHAFLPAFHHPGEIGHDRQEIFCFAAKEKPGHEVERLAPAFIQLPDVSQMNISLLQTLLSVNGFNTQICLSQKTNGALLSPMGRVASVPFHLLTIDPQQASKSEKDWQVSGSGSPFELLPVDAGMEGLTDVSSALVANGFICAGISAPHEGPLHLLFARLHKTTLAPTQPMRGFPAVEESEIMNLHHQFETAMV